MFLVRIINREVWPEDESIELDTLDADTITDLSTKENKLSTWLVENEDNVSSAILAYLASRDIRRAPEVVDAVIFKIEDVESCKLDFECCPIKTEIIDMVEKHYDIIRLNYNLLGITAQLITKNLLDYDRFFTFTKSEIDDLFKQAIKDNRIASSNIDAISKGALRKYISGLERQNTAGAQEAG